MRIIAALALSVTLTACGGGGDPETTPTPTSFSATPEQLDSLWAGAEAELAAEEWQEAAVRFERLLLELRRGDPRLPLARIKLGEARLGAESRLQAVREFRRVADDHPTDSLAPVGLLRAGDAYAELWRRPELDPTYGMQALATWQELLTRYPGSPTAVTTRERIATINNKFAVKALKAADFYLRYKAWDAAIIYLKDLVARYPQAPVVPEALEKLVGAYRTLGYHEDVQEICGYFRMNKPESDRLEVACPATSAAIPAQDSSDS